MEKVVFHVKMDHGGHDPTVVRFTNLCANGLKMNKHKYFHNNRKKKGKKN
jgi:hypothetical protein